MRRMVKMILIRLDDESTWPKGMLGPLNANLPKLAEYEAERARVDELCKTDVMLRITHGPTIHASTRRAVLAQLKAELSLHALAGYHCTRLTEDEIESIRPDGLRPLSEELFVERVDRCVKAGELPQSVASQIMAKNSIADDVRRDTTWFCFSREALSDEGDVGSLFRYWGGEAVYRGFKDDPEVGPVLRSIGVPVIVEAKVPVSEIDYPSHSQDYFLTAYLERRGISTGHGDDWQMDGTTRTGAKTILRVIPIHDPDFEVLTESRSWRNPLS